MPMRNHRPRLKMPVLFVGHGSPMNAIESNTFTRALEKLGQDLPRPGAISVVSAHWVTRGPRSDAHLRRARSYFSELLLLIPSFLRSVYAVVCAVSQWKQHLSQRHPARW